MKKMTPVLAALMIAYGLASCHDDGPSDAQTTNNSGDDSDTGLDIPISDTADGFCDGVPPSSGFNPLLAFESSGLDADLVVTTARDSGPGSLREKLALAFDGDVIGFDPSLSGSEIQLETGIIIERSVTVDGSAAAGITLDGGGAVPIITTEKALDVRLVGLVFRNGYSEDSGGAVHAGQTDEHQQGGKLTISGCEFIANSGGRGGAVRVGWRTEGVIEDSVFTDNDGTIGNDFDQGFSGGAIATSQSARLTVRRCRFERNRGINGGAIYNILQPVVVEDSVFAGNTASTSGALFTDGGNPMGPGNDSANKGEITLRRIRVEGSSGASAGGALMLWAYPGDVITIVGSIFRDNEVTGGGDGGKGGVARIHNPGSLLIRNVTFADNSAYQQGGALWIDGNGPVLMENVTFSGNTVENDAGGGFNYNGGGVVRINGCLFVDNFAGRACGAFWFGKSDLDMVVSNTIFAFNEAGQNKGERHMGYRPVFDGGIVEYVSDDPNVGRITETSLFADPMLDELREVDGMLLRPLLPGSPAQGFATVQTVDADARGALRDTSPDAGPFELDAYCVVP